MQVARTRRKTNVAIHSVVELTEALKKVSGMFMRCEYQCLCPGNLAASNTKAEDSDANVRFSLSASEKEDCMVTGDT